VNKLLEKGKKRVPVSKIATEVKGDALRLNREFEILAEGWGANA